MAGVETVQPVMGRDEADAVRTVLKAVLRESILVPHDEEKVRHAVEALEHAPVVDPRRARRGGARTTDPETSRKAAERIRRDPRAGSARAIALRSIVRGGDRGMTAYEVSVVAGLGGCYWKRVSELADGGFIEPKGAETRKSPESQASRQVYIATEKGRKWSERTQRELATA